MSTLYLPGTLLQYPQLDGKAYCYGRKGKESLFVIGFLEGNEEEVMKRIKAVGKSMDLTLEILGTIDGSSVSTQLTEETPQDNLFELVVFPNASPRLSSLGSLVADPTIIVYSPTRLNETISIRPLPLNLSKHRQDSTTPTLNITISRPRRLPGAPPRRKVRAEDIFGAELDRVIEWVSPLRISRISTRFSDCNSSPDESQYGDLLTGVQKRHDELPRVIEGHPDWTPRFTLRHSEPRVVSEIILVSIRFLRQAWPVVSRWYVLFYTNSM